MSKTKGAFYSLGSLFADYHLNDKAKYISREFQDYGCRLAHDLGDLAHKSLYIKLAKSEDRKLLEKARSFVIDADRAKSKGRLFMWKLAELKKSLKNKYLKNK